MTSTREALGSVVSLWRYPVKSMMGEEVNAAEVTKGGLLGDRAYALVDRSDGKVASAKNPRKWPTLFDFRSALTDAPRIGLRTPVRITLPDGTTLDSEQTNIHGTFFDSAFLHLLTTATLDRLGRLYPTGRFEVRRFRPNIVVETKETEPDFAENGWTGQILAIGDSVRLSITGPCARCVMTTLAQSDLPRDVGILRTAAQHNRANVGVYASVLRTGKVRRGDSVWLE